jgi:hypothetical protein
MAVSAEELRRHYQSLSDAALLEIDPAELVAAARTCLEDEIAARGLNDDAGDAEAASEAVAEAEPEQAEEKGVCVAEFDYLDEAELAKGLLEAGDVPVTLEHEPGVIRLTVPESVGDFALRLLATTPLSDEELAAQAEAAGFEEDEEEEGEEAAE